MMSQWTVQQVLQTAIEKEVESQRLYADLAERVREDAAREAFADLVQQERGHQHVLERYLRGDIVEGALPPRQVLDYKIAEHFGQPAITPQMSLKDVFLLAANREMMSHEFYQSLAGAHQDGEARRLLEDLAAQELGHKHRVEFLFTQVAFPQTDGG